MPTFLTRQPDGKYALWSTIIDDFTITNATRDELIEYIIRGRIESVRAEYNEAIDQIEAGKARYPRSGQINFCPYEKLGEV